MVSNCSRLAGPTGNWAAAASLRRGSDSCLLSSLAELGLSAREARAAPTQQMLKGDGSVGQASSQTKRKSSLKTLSPIE